MDSVPYSDAAGSTPAAPLRINILWKVIGYLLSKCFKKTIEVLQGLVSFEITTAYNDSSKRHAVVPTHVLSAQI